MGKPGTAGGHRRIATALFLRYRPLKRPYTEIEALLSIDLDMAQRGRLQSINAYSRIFGHSRGWCRTRIRQYSDMLSSLFIKEKEIAPDRNETVTGQVADSLRTPSKNRTEQSREKTRASRSPPSDWALECSDLLISLLSDVPGAVIPRRARDSWAREMERLVAECPELHSNGADPAMHIRGAIQWALGPQNLGQDYEVVIRSGRALREKWPKLRAAARRAEAKRQPTDAEFQQRILRRLEAQRDGAA